MPDAVLEKEDAAGTPSHALSDLGLEEVNIQLQYTLARFLATSDPETGRETLQHIRKLADHRAQLVIPAFLKSP
ncbi:MAG: hypothetical protein GDA53_04965 [Rhodobacteraceae bacterium]|nr:hypothetical protein [Paracoccaceae bacterium]